MFPGGGELFFILLVALLLFGGKELPKIARTLGKWSSTLRTSLNEVRREFNRISIEEEMKEAAKEFKEQLPGGQSRPEHKPTPWKKPESDTTEETESVSQPEPGAKPGVHPTPSPLAENDASSETRPPSTDPSPSSPGDPDEPLPRSGKPPRDSKAD